MRETERRYTWKWKEAERVGDIDESRCLIQSMFRTVILADFLNIRYLLVWESMSQPICLLKNDNVIKKLLPIGIIVKIEK